MDLAEKLLTNLTQDFQISLVQLREVADAG